MGVRALSSVCVATGRRWRWRWRGGFGEQGGARSLCSSSLPPSRIIIIESTHVSPPLLHDEKFASLRAAENLAGEKQHTTLTMAQSLVVLLLALVAAAILPGGESFFSDAGRKRARGRSHLVRTVFAMDVQREREAAGGAQIVSKEADASPPGSRHPALSPASSLLLLWPWSFALKL